MVYGVGESFDRYLKRAVMGRRPVIICSESLENGSRTFSWHYRSNYHGGEIDYLLTYWARLALDAGCKSYSEAMKRDDLIKKASRAANAKEGLED